MPKSPITSAPAPALLTADALRARYGISRPVAYRLLRDGKIAARKLGSRTLFTEESVARFIATLPELGGSPAHDQDAA